MRFNSKRFDAAGRRGRSVVHRSQTYTLRNALWNELKCESMTLEGAVAVSVNLVAEVAEVSEVSDVSAIAVSAETIAAFISRWSASAAAERANYQLFLTELCDLIGVPKPEPTKADVSENAYVFERDVTFQNLDGTTSPGRIDLYKRSCFVLEAKTIWPHRCNARNCDRFGPTRNRSTQVERNAKVTRYLADKLAKLAKSLEGAGHEPGLVAQFLMRCLFTMFAEDVELIPKDSFKELLHSLKRDDGNFPHMVRDLWESMDKGSFSVILRKKLRRFNGGLFEDCEALPLKSHQIELLIEAARCNWREVEPAIFGTLLERALDPVERHKLGAHYTPRAYVERLVKPTIIEPLREEWDAVRTAAVTLAIRGESPKAIETVRDFHHKLCLTRVLDPACGSGNFLYVALEHMKRLEGEVLNTLRELGYRQTEIITVDPHQFLGIEVNPRAAAIADLVLWIGYLQWHLRTRDLSQINEPIIRKFHNIECRDAVLDAQDAQSKAAQFMKRTMPSNDPIPNTGSLMSLHS